MLTIHIGTFYKSSVQTLCKQQVFSMELNLVADKAMLLASHEIKSGNLQEGNVKFISQTRIYTIRNELEEIITSFLS